MARLLLQFAEYRGSGSHKTGAAAAATLLVKNGDIPCWRWWESFATDWPELKFVAVRVLSKQVGIGAAERSHKLMKRKVFSPDRPNLGVSTCPPTTRGWLEWAKGIAAKACLCGRGFRICC
jgi:hypothetical protein